MPRHSEEKRTHAGRGVASGARRHGALATNGVSEASWDILERARTGSRWIAEKSGRLLLAELPLDDELGHGNGAVTPVRYGLGHKIPLGCCSFVRPHV